MSDEKLVTDVTGAIINKMVELAGEGGKLAEGVDVKKTADTYAVLIPQPQYNRWRADYGALLLLLAGLRKKSLTELQRIDIVMAYKQYVSDQSSSTKSAEVDISMFDSAPVDLSGVGLPNSGK